MIPLLEPIAQSQNCADLPETWQVPDIGHFSAAKTLYDYQTDALQKARSRFLSVNTPPLTGNEVP